jgi:hypothetical protein
MLKWLIPYDLNADYTLSFMAKGTGKIQTHIYSDAGTADVALFTERECEDYDVGVWGSANYTLTPDWKRRTVRWRTKGTRTQANALVVIRVDQGSEAYIAQPKLEKGCTATEWTDGDGDMVSTKALLATGIDIENRKVVITANNVQVQNNSGEQTFLLNADGKIQADLVEARNVTAMQIAQPFESYASLDAFKAGSSMSWRVTDVQALNDPIFGAPTDYNGGIVNIYNVTSSTIVFKIPLLLTSGFGAPMVATIQLPAYCLFRALAIQGLDSGGINMGYYPLVPIMEVTAQSGDIGKRYSVRTFLT